MISQKVLSVQFDFGGVVLSNAEPEDGDHEDQNHGDQKDVNGVVLDHAFQTEKDVLIEPIHFT